jgi:competence protein ComEC
MRDRIDRGLFEPSASLAGAIILGDKKGLPADLRTTFAQAGISHITAISGLHISILAALVMGALLGAGLPRRYAFYLSVLFLVIYIMLIGLPASAMRAGLMGFLVLWALELGRLSRLTNSLVLAAAILLFVNPRLLRDDTGFELSFLAVAGIAYFYPPIDAWIGRRLERSPRLRPGKIVKAAASVMALTVSAQIFTLPVIAYNFSFVSVIAPLTNLLVLWCLPPLMVMIMAALGISFLLPGLAVISFTPAWLLLGYITKTAIFMAALPASSLPTEYLWPGWIFIWYLFWAGMPVIANNRRKWKNFPHISSFLF